MNTNFFNKIASAIVRFFSYPATPLPDVKVQKYVEKILLKKDLYLESASAYGTPQYFYDEINVERAINRFNLTFKKYIDQFQMFYAMKSNHLPDISRKAVEMGCGLDVSSGMELESALSIGCRKIIFSGPGKRDEELELALKNINRVTIMLDSIGEYRRLLNVIRRTNKNIQTKISAGIRIRNPFQGNWNKFGTPLNELGLFLKTIYEDNVIEASGIQFHTSWNLGPESPEERPVELLLIRRRYGKSSKPSWVERECKGVDQCPFPGGIPAFEEDDDRNFCIFGLPLQIADPPL